MTETKVLDEFVAKPVLAIHTHAGAAATTAVARSLATLTGALVEEFALDEREGAAGRLAASRDAVRRMEPSMAVIAAPPAEAEMWWEFVRTAAGPVVVVPADAAVAPVRRVLLPLDGTSTSAAVVPLVSELLATDGVKLVALHVFEPTSVPLYWDHPTHARRAWSEEFLRRQCPQTGAELEIRTGEPGDRVLDVAKKVDADLIVLGWSQQLEPGRAAVVRATVEQARVPVLLFPVGTQPTGPSPLIDAASTG